MGTSRTWKTWFKRGFGPFKEKKIAKASQELKANPKRGTRVILRKKSENETKKEAKVGKKPQRKEQKIGNFGELLMEAFKEHTYRQQK